MVFPLIKILLVKSCDSFLNSISKPANKQFDYPNCL